MDARYGNYVVYRSSKDTSTFLWLKLTKFHVTMAKIEEAVRNFGGEKEITLVGLLADIPEAYLRLRRKAGPPGSPVEKKRQKNFPGRAGWVI
jgi:hypothetical protein